MAATGATKVAGQEQEQAGSVTRSLLNTVTSGSAVIAKLVAGANVSVTSTGVDAGTGDVTLSATGRNPIDNAEMRVAQRGTSFTNVASGASTPGLTLDRWCADRGGYAANLSISQGAGPSGFANEARVGRASSDTSTQYIQFAQVLESIEAARFAGQTVTFSATLRAGANFSPTGGTVAMVAYFGTGTDEGRAKFVSGWTGASNISSNVAVTATGTRFSFTGTVPSGATEIAVGFLWTPTGTAGASDYLGVTGVQLDLGSVAGPFEREPIAVTMDRVQRHYRTGTTRYDGYASAASQVVSTPERYGNGMRAVPAITITSTAATNCSTTSTAQSSTVQGFSDSRPATAAGAVAFTSSYTASADL